MNQSNDLLKCNIKNRRNADVKSKFIKVDSPIAKYDSAGNLSCIICRIPIKPNIWKVHLNSKQHKQNVELAKGQRTETENHKSEKLSTTTKHIEQIQKKEQIEAESIAQINIKLQPDDSDKTTKAQLNNTAQALPEKFFDNEKSVNTVGTDRDPEAEWNKFQREMREAATISNNIISEEQDSLNNKRHLKEIDEQIENWKRFIKINDRKKCIFVKQRTEKKSVQFDIDSSSDEECSVDDLLNWRIKSVHK